MVEPMRPVADHLRSRHAVAACVAVACVAAVAHAQDPTPAGGDGARDVARTSAPTRTVDVPTSDPEITRRETVPARTPAGPNGPEPARSTPSSREKLQQVDPGAADRNALQHSLRIMPVDLSPHGFERVYQVPGRDDLLMRSNGALYAVFDQSTYTRDPKKKTLKAGIPADTVFYIGRPDFSKIRGTGVRDMDFAHGSHDSASALPSNLSSIGGVQRVQPIVIDGRADGDRPARVEGRAENTPWCLRRFPDQDFSWPARTPERDGPPASAATARVDVAPSELPRQARPGFNERIDALMQRAKKAQ
jgi:hypothetical protein